MITLLFRQRPIDSTHLASASGWGTSIDATCSNFNVPD
jgi:hypothetical protein